MVLCAHFARPVVGVYILLMHGFCLFFLRLAFWLLIAGSTNSLFSTAIISGSSSAPELKDVLHPNPGI